MNCETATQALVVIDVAIVVSFFVITLFVSYLLERDEADRQANLEIIRTMLRQPHYEGLECGFDKV